MQMKKAENLQGGELSVPAVCHGRDVVQVYTLRQHAMTKNKANIKQREDVGNVQRNFVDLIPRLFCFECPVESHCKL